MRRALGLLLVIVACLGLAWPGPANAHPSATVTATAPAAGTDLAIATLPATPGYLVTYKKMQARADAAGVAHFPVLAASVPDDLATHLTLTSQQVEVHGVAVQVRPARLFVRGGTFMIWLNVFYQVRFGFKNSNGGPLDTSLIHELTVKSSIGAVDTLPAHRPVWLQGSRVVPLAGSLEVKKLYWTIQDVQFAGTNIVNSSQQRFKPADNQAVPVTLLFFKAHVRVHDAFFGFRGGGTVVLSYPDGARKTLPLDSSGSLLLPSLPRGNYSIVINGFGPRMTQQLAISTNQNLDLKYYSWLDIGVVVLAVLFFSVGLLMIGVRRRRRSRSTHAPAHRTEAIHAEKEKATVAVNGLAAQPTKRVAISPTQNPEVKSDSRLNLGAVQVTALFSRMGLLMTGLRRRDRSPSTQPPARRLCGATPVWLVKEPWLAGRRRTRPTMSTPVWTSRATRNPTSAVQPPDECHEDGPSLQMQAGDAKSKVTGPA